MPSHRQGGPQPSSGSCPEKGLGLAQPRAGGPSREPLVPSAPGARPRAWSSRPRGTVSGLLGNKEGKSYAWRGRPGRGPFLRNGRGPNRHSAFILTNETSTEEGEPRQPRAPLPSQSPRVQRGALWMRAAASAGSSLTLRRSAEPGSHGGPGSGSPAVGFWGCTRTHTSPRTGELLTWQVPSSRQYKCHKMVAPGESRRRGTCVLRTQGCVLELKVHWTQKSIVSTGSERAKGRQRMCPDRQGTAAHLSLLPWWAGPDLHPGGAGKPSSM